MKLHLSNISLSTKEAEPLGLLRSSRNCCVILRTECKLFKRPIEFKQHINPVHTVHKYIRKYILKTQSLNFHGSRMERYIYTRVPNLSGFADRLGERGDGSVRAGGKHMYGHSSICTSNVHTHQMITQMESVCTHLPAACASGDAGTLAHHFRGPMENSSWPASEPWPRVWGLLIYTD